METKEFVKNYNRLCDKYKSCNDCPLGAYETDCGNIVSNPGIIDIVEKWAEKNPQKSNYDKMIEVLKETFPGVPFSKEIDFWSPNIEEDTGEVFLCNLITCHGYSHGLCDKCEYKTFWADDYNDKVNN